ncbi:MAG: alpha-L-fucosidase [bacterium]|nr:alpha-L-fucosidase [bacterium]
MSGPIYESTWESLDARPVPAWFGAAKFGIFIHWGVYSVPAWTRLREGRYASYAEWYQARVMGELSGSENFHAQNYGADFEYRDFAPQFRAELFDPAAWAALFADSGARYVVLTAKHHDGYCLWPTACPHKSNWNSQDVGPGRDLVGEITEAVRARGLKMGLYYSMIEWESCRTARTPAGRYIPQAVMEKYGLPPERYVAEIVDPQLRELVSVYKPSLLFADGGEWDEGEPFWGTKRFLAWLYGESAVREEVVVNDRWFKGMGGRHGDYFSSEYDDADVAGLGRPWEENRGIGLSYGFNRAESLQQYRTSRELIHELIDIVARGGNLLLNVGPTADGRIPAIMQQRLHDIGAWLEVNSPAVFDTEPCPDIVVTGCEARVRCLRNGRDLYLICLDWPDPELQIGGGADVESVTFLGYPGEIPWRREGGRLRISPPLVSPAILPFLDAWVFRVKGMFTTD